MRGSEGGLFASVYRLVSADKSRKALTGIYDYLGDLILSGRFAEVDAALRDVDISQLDPTCMLGFLSITFPARERLTEWEPFLARTRQACLERGMEDAKVERLFGGLC